MICLELQVALPDPSRQGVWAVDSIRPLQSLCVDRDSSPPPTLCFVVDPRSQRRGPRALSPDWPPVGAPTFEDREHMYVVRKWGQRVSKLYFQIFVFIVAHVVRGRHLLPIEGKSLNLCSLSGLSALVHDSENPEREAHGR